MKEKMKPHRWQVFGALLCVIVLAASVIFEIKADVLGIAQTALLAIVQTASVVVCAYLFYDKLNKGVVVAAILTVPVFAAAFALVSLIFRVMANCDLSYPHSVMLGFQYSVIAALVGLAAGYLCGALISLIFHKIRKRKHCEA